jgi:hypothetical protein
MWVLQNVAHCDTVVPLVVVVVTAPCSVAGEPGGGGRAREFRSQQVIKPVIPPFPSSLLINAHVEQMLKSGSQFSSEVSLHGV